MAAFLLDGRMCPALFLDGNPRRAVYWYKSTEGNTGVETRVSNSLVFVPNDNGDSWNASNCPHGANMVLIVPDDERLGEADYMQSLNNRLVTAHNNQYRVFGEAQAANAPASGGDEQSTESSESNEQPTWQRLGFKNEQKWINAGSPTE